MSDIRIDLGWPVTIEYFVMMAFWPLAIVVALFGFLYWLTRRSGDARSARVALASLIVVCVPLAASGAGWAYLEGSQIADARATQAYVRDHSRTLKAPETIGKIRFPAGTVVEDDGVIGSPLEVTLPGPTTIGGIPTRDTVQLYADTGLTGTLALTRTATIDGLTCAAGDDVGFAGGKLTKCHLAKAVVVHGVPCSGDIDRSGPVSCTLSAPYRSHGIVYGAGTDWTDFGTSTMAIVGAIPPDVRVLGKKLRLGTIVRFDAGSIDVEMPFLSGGCYVHDVFFHVASRTVTTTGDNACTTRLPASTFSFATGSR